MRGLPERLKAHFDDPRFVGRITPSVDEAAAGQIAPSGQTVSGQGTNLACLDDLRLYLRLQDNRLEARFQAQACSAVIAMASLTAETLQDLSLESARELDVELLAREAGGLPRGKQHAAQVVQRALEQALEQLPESPVSNGEGAQS